MAQFNKEIVMTITKDDRAWLSFGNYTLTEILVKMKEEDAEYLENTYTGEVIEKEDIEKAIWTIESLIDSQESWGWKLV